MKNLFINRLTVGFGLLTFFGYTLMSCNSGEIERLKTENDSLKHELATMLGIMTTMREVGGYIDSIDSRRKSLNVLLHEGTSYNGYSERMKDINDYIKKSESKLTAMEEQLKLSVSDTSAYFLVLSALKDELTTRLEEIYELEVRVENYRKESDNLIQTVKMQETGLSTMEADLEVKRQQVNLFENKIQEMVEQMRMTEAEGYYSRGLAVEEAARRTRLAPQKKRDTMNEALELFKKAYSLGKKEARAKILELEGKN